MTLCRAVEPEIGSSDGLSQRICEDTTVADGVTVILVETQVRAILDVGHFIAYSDDFVGGALPSATGNVTTFPTLSPSPVEESRPVNG